MTAGRALPAEKAKLGALIRAKRLDLGMTQKELAQLIGTHQTSIKDWERGICAPNVKIAPRLATALGLPLSDVLLTGGRNRISALCALRGITIKALAEQLGTQNQNLADVAAGRRGVSPEYARRIASALGCSVRDLEVRVTRSTRNVNWQTESCDGNTLKKRDELFERFHWTIPECMKRYRLNIRASHAEPDDVYQTLACELCRILYSLIQRGKADAPIANYIRAGLKMTLLNYTIKANKKGITHAPTDGSINFVSIEAMIDAGMQI